MLKRILVMVLSPILAVIVGIIYMFPAILVFVSGLIFAFWSAH